MSDISDLIEKIRAADLPKARKRELEHRLIREGPRLFDVDKAIRDALKAPYKQIDSIADSGEIYKKDRERQDVASLCATVAVLFLGMLYLINPDAVNSFFSNPKPAPVEVTVQKPAPKPLKVISVTTWDLHNDFERNAIAAEKKYGEAIVQVEGFIIDIGRDMHGNAYVLFSNKVQCFFDEADADSLAVLSTGRNVTIVGIVVGKFVNVQLAKCKLM